MIAKAQVDQRINDVLTGRDSCPEFKRLTSEERALLGPGWAQMPDAIRRLVATGLRSRRRAIVGRSTGSRVLLRRRLLRGRRSLTVLLLLLRSVRRRAVLLLLLRRRSVGRRAVLLLLWRTVLWSAILLLRSVLLLGRRAVGIWIGIARIRVIGIVCRSSIVRVGIAVTIAAIPGVTQSETQAEP